MKPGAATDDSKGKKQENERTDNFDNHPAPRQNFYANFSLARTFWLADLSWPQAAMMSRPRGVRTGEE